MTGYNRAGKIGNKEIAVFNVIFGALLLMLTINSVVAAYRYDRLAERCTETAQGEVTAVTKVRRSRKTKHRRHEYYVYKTEYAYSVGGEQFIGSVTLFESGKLSEGDGLEVYYDPDDPSDNYNNYTPASKGSIGSAVFFGICTVVFLPSGVLLLWEEIKPKRRSEKKAEARMKSNCRADKRRRGCRV